MSNCSQMYQELFAVASKQASTLLPDASKIGNCSSGGSNPSPSAIKKQRGSGLPVSRLYQGGYPKIVNYGRSEVKIYAPTAKEPKYRIQYYLYGLRKFIDRPTESSVLDTAHRVLLCLHKRKYDELAAIHKEVSRGQVTYLNVGPPVEFPPVPKHLNDYARLVHCFHYVSVPCVYFLCQAGVVVYVGQTRNLNARIAAHTKGKKFDYVYYLPCTPDLLTEVEERFIAELNPIYNINCFVIPERDEVSDLHTTPNPHTL